MFMSQIFCIAFVLVVAHTERLNKEDGTPPKVRYAAFKLLIAAKLC